MWSFYFASIQRCPRVATLRFVCVLVLLCGVGVLGVRAQEGPQVEGSITVRTDAGGMKVLTFGLDPAASDGIDAEFGEEELPPPPPPGSFDTRWIADDITISGFGNGLLVDVRRGASHFRGRKKHQLQFQAESEATEVRIAWTLPEGVTGVIEDQTGDVYGPVEMTGTDSITVAPGAPDAVLTLDYGANARVGIEVARSFGDPADAASYQLVALPGQVDQPLAEVIEGRAGTDWQAFWDDGSARAQNPLVPYDGSETFRFRPGRGFWLMSRRPWVVRDSVAAVALTDDQAATIPLHDGWNIISNPLGMNVSWTTVVEANGGSLQPIWAFDGGFTQAETFRSAATGEAYYFRNDRSLDSLRIPHPNADSQTKGASNTHVQSERRSRVHGATGRDGSLRTRDDAAPGIHGMDARTPRAALRER